MPYDSVLRKETSMPNESYLNEKKGSKRVTAIDTLAPIVHVVHVGIFENSIT